tara:strand:+ start:149 stop:346 length:198 start_codon:yes stop_codon:yes gene_type:complete
MVYNDSENASFGHESNLITVDKIIVLMEEIAILEHKLKPQGTGHLHTTISVLKERIKELRARVHD